MGYEIEWDTDDKKNGWVTFTSKTRVGLNEEIDRFMEELQPLKLEGKSGRLVPMFGKNMNPSSQKGLWSLQMHVIGKGR